MANRTPYRWLLLLGLAGGLLVGVGLLSPQQLLQRITGAETGRFLLVLLVGYLLRPLVAFPMAIITVVVGFRFGVLGGFPVAMAGTLLTCSLPFVVGSYLQGERGLLGAVTRVGERMTEITGGKRAMIAARLSPAPADAVSYTAGISGITARDYLLGTAVGETPWALLYLSVGASTQAVADANTTPDLSVLVGFCVAAVALLVRPIYETLGTDSADQEG